jgi:hypothetical protein
MASEHVVALDCQSMHLRWRWVYTTCSLLVPSVYRYEVTAIYLGAGSHLSDQQRKKKIANVNSYIIQTYAAIGLFIIYTLLHTTAHSYIFVVSLF